MRTVYRLGDILPNPYRNIERYPIDRTKVEALKSSIERTGFWDNIVARPVDGKTAEIAYGHHRLVALREVYDDDKHVALITRDLDDAAMLHIMADENMQEWSSSGAVIVETVRAVRDFIVSGARRKRQGSNGTTAGSAAEVTAFLGWPQDRVQRALAIILAEEAGDLEPEDTVGLELRQADELRKATGSIKKPEVKREAIARVRTKIASGDIGYRGVRDVVNEVKGEVAATTRTRPPVPAAVAERLWRDIDAYWRTTLQVGDQYITRVELLRLIAEHRNTEELTRSVTPWADQLADALDEMATEAKSLADLLRAEQAVAIGA